MDVEKNATVALHFVIGDDEGKYDGSFTLVIENEKLVFE